MRTHTQNTHRLINYTLTLCLLQFTFPPAGLEGNKHIK